MQRAGLFCTRNAFVTSATGTAHMCFPFSTFVAEIEARSDPETSPPLSCPIDARAEIAYRSHEAGTKHGVKIERFRSTTKESEHESDTAHGNSRHRPDRTGRHGGESRFEFRRQGLRRSRIQPSLAGTRTCRRPVRRGAWPRQAARRNAFDPRTGRIGETASADSDDDPGRGARRRGDRTADALSGAGRRGDRRGQFQLSRYAETGRAGGKGRAVVRGMRRIGRRTGRFARSFAYAGRIGCGMAADQRAVSGHRGQASTTARRAASGSDRADRVISSKRSTTASNTATCS